MSTVRVVQGSSASTVYNKRPADVTIGGAGFNTANLQNGFTLVYDATTNKWVAQPAVTGNITTLDGGTF